MNASARTGLLAIALVLSACSAKEQPARHGDNVWGDQVRAYDRTRAVQGTLQDAAKKERKKIDQQTQ